MLHFVINRTVPDASLGWGHLRVGGDLAEPLVGRDVAGDALDALAVADLVQREELGRSAERVAHCTSPEAASKGRIPKGQSGLLGGWASRQARTQGFLTLFQRLPSYYPLKGVSTSVPLDAHGSWAEAPGQFGSPDVQAGWCGSWS